MSEITKVMTRVSGQNKCLPCVLVVVCATCLEAGDAFDPFRSERHPTVVEFRKEIFAADTIIRARVKSICSVHIGTHPEVPGKVGVLIFFKGDLSDADP